MKLRCLLIALLFAVVITPAEQGQWLSCPAKKIETGKRVQYEPDLPAHIKNFTGNVEGDPPHTYYIWTVDSVGDPRPCARKVKAEVDAAIGQKFNSAEAERLPKKSETKEAMSWLYRRFLEPAYVWATSVTDDFNRANEDPLDNSVWSVYADVDGLEIVSNVVRANAQGGVDNFQTRLDISPTNNQYAQVKLTTIGSGTSLLSNYAGVVLRFTAPETRQGYLAFIQVFNSLGENLSTRLNTVNGDTYVLISSVLTPTWADGDTLRGTVNGSTLSVYRCAPSCSLELSASDATYTSGRVGAEIYVETGNGLDEMEIDDFAGGDLADLTTGAGRRARSGVRTIQ